MSETDPRRLRSKEAIRLAFFTMVLDQRYHTISIASVIERAGVARSTFYEHFRSKDDLLTHSLVGPFLPLAELAGDYPDTTRVTGMLEHFWAHRTLAPGIFQGAVGRRASKQLVHMLGEHLPRHTPLRIPRQLIAIQLGGMLLTSVEAWLSGATACPAADLADALIRSARGVRQSLHITVA